MSRSGIVDGAHSRRAPAGGAATGETANLIVVTMALDLLEGLPSEAADLVFLHQSYETGGMGALAFSPEVGARDLVPHLEHVSRSIQQANRVLRATGTLFLWTDPFIAAHSRMIADRVFGAERFATQFVVPSAYGPHSEQVWPDYDVILAYTRSAEGALHVLRRPWTVQEARELFGHSDEHGPFQLMDLTRPASPGGFSYTWTGVDLPEGRTWRYPADTLDELAAEHRIVMHRESGVPCLRTYMADVPDTPIGSVWSDLGRALQHESEEWPADDAVLALTRYPLAVIDRIIMMGSDPGDLVVAPWDPSASLGVCASRLGRRWVIGSNVPAFTRGAVDRMDRHGYREGADFEVIGLEEAGARFPSVQHGYRDVVSGLVPERSPTFVLGDPVPFEESLRVEFKEIKGRSARDHIKADAADYAVGFLNREGGRIFWGIRDDRVTVGVHLDSAQRDAIRKLVVDQLAEVDPPPAPTQYDIRFHSVVQPEGGDPDLFVIELSVSRGDPNDLYCTGPGKYFVKTESGKRQLVGRAQKDEIRRRALNLQPHPGSP